MRTFKVSLVMFILMRYFLYFYLSFLTLCQNVQWNSSEILYQNYVTWDYNDGMLFYYSDIYEYRCNISTKKCQEIEIDYYPTTFILTSNYFYFNDKISGKICQSEYNGTRVCHFFENTQDLPEFHSISVNHMHFYSRIPENSSIAIYDIKSWSNQPLSFLNTLKNLNTSWYVKEDGLYASRVLETNVEIVKYSLDGQTRLWKSIFPNCQTTDPQTEILFTVKRSIVYVICTPVDLLTLYNSTDGIIIFQYAIDKGNAVAIECSSQFLFILYSDGTAVQYTLDFNYVYTYSLENMKSPKYNFLKVDDEYLLYSLCVYRSGNERCFIYQWSVQKFWKKITFAYSNTKYPERKPDITTNFETTLMIKRRLINFDTISSGMGLTNSFFTSVVYNDGRENHLIFFSGGGILSKGVCGDIFVHDMIIGENNGTFSLFATSNFNLAPINSPLKDYAATLVKDQGKYFYIIHGGTSCDSEKTFSELFAIHILDKKYIKLLQNVKIA